MGGAKGPKVKYEFVGISQIMQDEAKEFVQHKLDGKMTSAFKKLYANNSNVEIILDLHLEKTSKGRYDGSVNLSYNGEIIPYSPDTPFKILIDIISHAFDRFKTEILSK